MAAISSLGKTARPRSVPIPINFDIRSYCGQDVTCTLDFNKTTHIFGIWRLEKYIRFRPLFEQRFYSDIFIGIWFMYMYSIPMYICIVNESVGIKYCVTCNVGVAVV